MSAPTTFRWQSLLAALVLHPAGAFSQPAAVAPPHPTHLAPPIAGHQPLTLPPLRLETAQQIAVETQRDVVVLVGAAWCAECQIMKQQTLPEVAARGGLNRSVYAEVDFDQQPELAGALMYGTTLPQVVCLKFHNDGWIRAALIPRPAEASKIIEMIGWVQSLQLAAEPADPLLPSTASAPAFPPRLPNPADHARR